MSKTDVSTPAEEVKDTAPTATESTKAESTEDAKEETIADAMKDEKDNKIPDSIPYDRFKEKVDESKELARRVAELESKIQEQDMSRREVKSDLSDIANEYDIPTEALDKVAEKLYSKAQATIEERLAPLTAKERAEKQDKVLSSMLQKALEANPDYQSVVNQDVIKQLALNPANANKTFTQLIQETYGNAVTPAERKTMETTSPGKSEAIDKVDYERAKTDIEYFRQIKADPALRKEYNEQQLKDMSRYL